VVFRGVAPDAARHDRRSTRGAKLFALPQGDVPRDLGQHVSLVNGVEGEVERKTRVGALHRVDVRVDQSSGRTDRRDAGQPDADPEDAVVRKRRRVLALDNQADATASDVLKESME